MGLSNSLNSNNFPLKWESMRVSRFGKGKEMLSFKYIKFKMSNRCISASLKYTDEYMSFVAVRLENKNLGIFEAMKPRKNS